VTSTFDKVHSGNGLLRSMQGHNICEKYMKLKWTRTTTSTDNNQRIEAGNTLTEAVPITTSIRQADSLISILFNLIMDEIIRNVKDIGAECRK